MVQASEQHESTIMIVSLLSRAGELSARQLASTLNLGHPTIHSKLRLLVSRDITKVREVGGELMFSLTDEAKLSSSAKRRLKLRERLDFPLPTWMPGGGLGDFLESLR